MVKNLIIEVGNSSIKFPHQNSYSRLPSTVRVDLYTQRTERKIANRGFPGVVEEDNVYTFGDPLQGQKSFCDVNKTVYYSKVVKSLAPENETYNLHITHFDGLNPEIEAQLNRELLGNHEYLMIEDGRFVNRSIGITKVKVHFECEGSLEMIKRNNSDIKNFPSQYLMIDIGHKTVDAIIISNGRISDYQQLSTAVSTYGLENIIYDSVESITGISPATLTPGLKTESLVTQKYGQPGGDQINLRNVDGTDVYGNSLKIWKGNLNDEIRRLGLSCLRVWTGGGVFMIPKEQRYERFDEYVKAKRSGKSAFMVSSIEYPQYVNIQGLNYIVNNL